MPVVIEADGITEFAHEIDKYSLIRNWRKSLPFPPILHSLPTPSLSGDSRQNDDKYPLKRKRVCKQRLLPRCRQKLDLDKNRCMDGSEGSGWTAEVEVEEGKIDQDTRSEDQPRQLLQGRRERRPNEAVLSGRITKKASRSRSSNKGGPILKESVDGEQRQQQRLWNNPDFDSASTFELPSLSEITASSRSRSPVKSVINLRTAKPSTVFLSTAPGVECPEPVTKLRLFLTKGAYRNEGVIPEALEPAVRAYLGQYIDQLSYNTFGASTLSAEEEQKLWRKVQKLSKAAQECEGQSEETWSDNFVFKIFEFAIKQSRLTDFINAVNVKNTPPATELLPRDIGLASLPVQRKQIDYLFALKPSPMTSRHIDQVLSLEPDVRKRSINQTADASLAILPVFALVEMKKRYQTYDPLIQIGIWAAAGFERLRLLAALASDGNEEKGRERPLPIPIWTTQGGSWSLYIAWSPSDEKIEVYGPVMIKNAGDLVDVFSLVETNRRIMRWGFEVYGPWFEQAVLRPILHPIYDNTDT